MESAEQLKSIVKEKYGQIASDVKSDSCCGPSCCDGVNNIMSDDYDEVGGYLADADLGLGCGLPTQFAKIKKGDVVIDLGSGAGNDVFIARHETGESGYVLGIDFTPAMLEKARKNNELRGFSNVEFREGDIDNMPVKDNYADVIVSNCVLNLVPDKKAVFNEIFRVLKPGGHFSISDIVLKGDLPAEFTKAAEMYAGCVSGAIQKSDYLALIESAGFEKISLQKEKEIILPDNMVSEYLDETRKKEFKNSGLGIFSITVYGEKPAGCCQPGCCS